MSQLIQPNNSHRFGRDARRLLSPEPAAGRAWAPAVDVSEDATEIVLQVELPGMKREEIDVELSGDLLRLSGERRRDEVTRGEHFHRIERHYGAFQRSFVIEAPIDHARVAANYHDGVLTLRLPKQAAAKARQIPIESR